MFDGAGILTVITLFGGFPLVPGSPDRVVELGLDSLSPTQSDRQLDTVNLHAFVLDKHYAPLRLHLRLGATASRVTGRITQLEGSYEDGTLHEVTLDSPAIGLGPVTEATVNVWNRGAWRLDANLSAGVLFYDRPFPAGGKRYDGMFQVGPTLSYQWQDDYRWSLGYRWMHVSNGRGLGPDNPAYEAAGVTLRVERLLGGGRD